MGRSGDASRFRPHLPAASDAARRCATSALPGGRSGSRIPTSPAPTIVCGAPFHGVTPPMSATIAVEPLALDAPAPDAPSFGELGVSDALVARLTERGIYRP